MSRTDSGGRSSSLPPAAMPGSILGERTNLVLQQCMTEYEDGGRSGVLVLMGVFIVVNQAPLLRPERGGVYSS